MNEADSEDENISFDDLSYGLHHIVDLFSTVSETDARKFKVVITVENYDIEFEVDSDAGYPLIPEDLYMKINSNKQLQPANIAFRTYTGEIIRPLGKILPTAEYNGKKCSSNSYVVPSGSDPLVGRT